MKETNVSVCFRKHYHGPNTIICWISYAQYLREKPVKYWVRYEMQKWRNARKQRKTGTHVPPLPDLEAKVQRFPFQSKNKVASEAFVCKDEEGKPGNATLGSK